ncbi:AAA family ATPase [Candidatus Chloroploca sp. Khr17]|uniref:AAA family ATPase n=1 Tax=Candidatus Chloroploca sp. Khr17 TaxID=2496869 RepID=UPI00101B9E95|nr:AAA family ATPase [Candidatus Chloroploca sp. Khr17]
MQITSLQLSQVRGYEQAEFHFGPGMNLLVGVNGVGKSTVLDVLRIMFMRALPRLTNIKLRSEGFTTSDIANERGALTAELRMEVGGAVLHHLIHHPRERYLSTSQEGAVRDQTYDREARDDLSYRDEQGVTHHIDAPNDLPSHIKLRKNPPLAVYFSTRRSLYSEATGSQRERSGGGPTFAFADALRSRELRIREYANWWLVQEELGQPERVAALQTAVLRFLDNFTNVRVIRAPEPMIVLDKRDTSLAVHQLSDGERGMLSLVLDLARRLALANPKLDDPLRDGQAVVLIDELDLHLHPRWQRTVVHKLTETFPACQFIATTHSPQIIGEVAPEQIILLEPGKQPYRPDQSLGMDSNWILQMLMGAPERNEETTRQLEQISDFLEEGSYEEAAAAIEQLRIQIPSDPELTRLQTRLDRLQILGE